MKPRSKVLIQPSLLTAILLATFAVSDGGSPSKPQFEENLKGLVTIVLMKPAKEPPPNAIVVFEQLGINTAGRNLMSHSVSITHKKSHRGRTFNVIQGDMRHGVDVVLTNQRTTDGDNAVYRTNLDGVLIRAWHQKHGIDEPVSQADLDDEITYWVSQEPAIFSYLQKNHELQSQQHQKTKCSSFATFLRSGLLQERIANFVREEAPMLISHSVMGGCVGALLPDVIRVIRARYDPRVPMYLRSTTFWIGMLLLVAVGGLTAWFANARSARDALAYGYAAPELLSSLLAEGSNRPRPPAPFGRRAFYQPVSPIRTIRQWWGLGVSHLGNYPHP
ncbi:MAG: hypothetical protein ABSD31_17130 [Candidatus Binataceae bacterium]|jgi:hypothetical protein